jgi:hypothetical protein
MTRFDVFVAYFVVVVGREHECFGAGLRLRWGREQAHDELHDPQLSSSKAYKGLFKPALIESREKSASQFYTKIYHLPLIAFEFGYLLVKLIQYPSQWQKYWESLLQRCLSCQESVMLHRL